MQTTELLLFRLNFVDTGNLFQNKPLRKDEDFLSILAAASNENYDNQTHTRSAVYKWSLRSFHSEVIDEDGRRFALVTFARSTMSKLGSTVTASSIEIANSVSTPPPALDTLVIVDVKWHIVAVEYSSVLMQSEVWRKQLEAVLNKTANDAGFTSYIRLEAIMLPDQTKETLASFEKITKISVTLAIPNPDIGETFERLYREMNEGRIREMKQVMSNPNGMNTDEGSLPRMSIDMALSGYRDGKIIINGVQNGVPANVSIGDTDQEHEIARVKVEGLGEYAQGLRDATKSSEAKKAMRLMLKKMDDLLKYNRQA